MDVFVRHRRLLLVAVITFAGCQTTDPSVELLESELRWMEDQLYSLDRQLDRTCLQLASAKNNNRALQRELADFKRQSAEGKPTPASPPRAAAEPVPPSVEVPPDDAFDEDSLQVPRIEMGPDESPDVKPPSDNGAPPRLDESLDEDLDDFTRHGDVDIRVTRIVLNSRLTGGYDFDGKPGDEGLLVVVEPQNSAGQYVPLPGHLVIEVTDPSAVGAAGRLARWEFDADETVGFIKKSLLGRGLHLQLPWPGTPPKQQKLKVDVRYQPPTGDTLLAQREIRVDLVPGQRRLLQTSPSSLPDEFVPTSSPQLSQLLPERTFAVPVAPLSPEDINQRSPYRQESISLPQTATRRSNSRSARRARPTWSPYR